MDENKVFILIQFAYCLEGHGRLGVIDRYVLKMSKQIHIITFDQKGKYFILFYLIKRNINVLIMRINYKKKVIK